jgi:hypothetical protein
MTGTAPDTATNDTVAAGRKGRALFRIQTFTGRYDPVEDRLRLDAVNAAGEKQSIFLTRRLVDRVIPVLVSHLEGKTPEGVPADLAQGMSQSRARQARQTAEATPAVATDAETPTWLCRTMHFQKADHGLTVIFTDDTQTDAVMPMAEANLRAVLDILLDLYTKANWPTEPFPEWMKPEATVTISPAQGTRLN